MTDPSGFQDPDVGPDVGIEVQADVELIAHRAGNVAGTTTTFAGQADTIELDIRVERGRLVVRHPRRVWFTSRLWEREGGWHLLPADTPVLELSEAVASVTAEAPHAMVWLDCKGFSLRTPRRALEVVEPLVAEGDGPITVSSKAWWMLGSVDRRPGVRVVRSVSNRWELLLVRFLPSRVELDGVVAHSRLLGGRLVSTLRRRYGRVFSWSIPDVATGQRLAEWGVDGLIIDEPEVLAELRHLSQRGSKQPPPDLT